MNMRMVKPIKGLPGYILTPDNYVYSKEACRKLTRRWFKQEWYSGIRFNHKTYFLSHREMSSPLFDIEGVIKSSTENLDGDDAQQIPTQQIPGFPAYVVSEKGEVWRVKPYNNNNRGRKTPFQLKVRKHHGSDYYKLTAEDGKVSIKRAARIVKEAWSDDA